MPADKRTAVRNNGGGHSNHSLFWEIMGPGGGGEPNGALGEAISSTFGSFADFQGELKARPASAGSARAGRGSCRRRVGLAVG